MIRWNNGTPPIERLLLHTVPEPNTGCVLWLGAATRDGYAVSMWGADRTYRVIRAILGIWGESPRVLAMHECDQPLCINPKHLRIGDHRKNWRDCVARGRSRPPRGSRHFTSTRPDRIARGERSGQSKLTNAAVCLIRSSAEPTDSLAVRFGVDPATIRRVRSGRSWSHLQPAAGARP